MEGDIQGLLILQLTVRVCMVTPGVVQWGGLDIEFMFLFHFNKKETFKITYHEGSIYCRKFRKYRKAKMKKTKHPFYCLEINV